MMLKKRNVILKDESGVVMIVALFMILVLTLIGLSSTSNSTFEIKLSGNKRGSTDAFYIADGGAQAVKANITNFDLSNGFASVDPGALAYELQTEDILQKATDRSFSLPPGVSFADEPEVTIYYSGKKTVPRGIGVSAVNFEYSHYIVDSVGKDQMDVSLIKSNCQIREKIVRLIPTKQGGR